jgi:hypothetical protein
MEFNRAEWDSAFFNKDPRQDLFTISGTAYRDAWNIDLGKLKDCCTTVPAPNGNLMPYCEYSLTGKTGHTLCRDTVAWC